MLSWWTGHDCFSVFCVVQQHGCLGSVWCTLREWEHRGESALEGSVGVTQARRTWKSGVDRGGVCQWVAVRQTIICSYWVLEVLYVCLGDWTLFFSLRELDNQVCILEWLPPQHIATQVGRDLWATVPREILNAVKNSVKWSVWLKGGWFVGGGFHILNFTILLSLGR